MKKKDPDTNPLRIGLAGYGNWAREAYVPALRADGRGRVAAAAAPSQATRQRIREELGSQVRIYPHFEAMLEAGGLDGVLMALPEAVHEPALLAAIGSKIPFFYEPPVSHRRDRIPPVLEKLLGAPQVHQADLELRFLPVVAAAAERLAQGAIGEPQAARIRMNGTWSARPGADLSLPNLLAPWYVDALDAILGSNPRRVLVQDGRGTGGRMQAYALTQLDYGGVWGTFQANISSVHGPRDLGRGSGPGRRSLCGSFHWRIANPKSVPSGVAGRSSRLRPSALCRMARLAGVPVRLPGPTGGEALLRRACRRHGQAALPGPGGRGVRRQLVLGFGEKHGRVAAEFAMMGGRGWLERFDS